MIVCLGILLFIENPVAYFFPALLYALLVATEMYGKIISPISISMLIFYIGWTILSLHTTEFQGYAGIFAFSWLGILASGLFIVKKPFSIFYSKGKGIISLHYVVSGMWCIIYILSACLGILLIPHVSYIIIPYILCICGGLFTMFFHFIYFGKPNKFQENFTIGKFEFLKISRNSELFQEFCLFYTKQIYENDALNREKTIDEMAEIVCKDEFELGDDAYIFVALYAGRIIGCIRCILDRKNRPFPLEKDIGVSFIEFRKKGKLLYVGRLAIDSNFRERPDVLSGLFKCFIDLSLEEDVSFVLAEGLAGKITLYIKLGFEFLFEKFDARHKNMMSHGYFGYPVFLNFSKLIFYGNSNEKSRQNSQFSNVINRYLMERWYKRNAVKHGFKNPTSWPWRISLDAMRRSL